MVGEITDVNTKNGIMYVTKHPKKLLFVDMRPHSLCKVKGVVCAAEVSQIRGHFSSMSNRV